ncbi:MAG: hypothetical protein DRO99_04885 [Candidatus Aenigmatarchaeota archaeon]|nr:MAG: hypothetical protein DRO99_04885 [Candidatus Aenigmarchaeota archaeon]
MTSRKKHKDTDKESVKKLEGVVKAGGVTVGILEELIKNKEEILIAFLKVVEGKEARAKVNLDGVKFNVGKSAVRMEGEVEFTFIPIEEKR